MWCYSVPKVASLVWFVGYTKEKAGDGVTYGIIIKRAVSARSPVERYKI